MIFLLRSWPTLHWTREHSVLSSTIICALSNTNARPRIVIVFSITSSESTNPSSISYSRSILIITASINTSSHILSDVALFVVLSIITVDYQYTADTLLELDSIAARERDQFGETSYLTCALGAALLARLDHAEDHYPHAYFHTCRAREYSERALALSPSCPLH